MPATNCHIHALFVNRHTLATSSHVHELDVAGPWLHFESLPNLESLVWRVLQVRGHSHIFYATVSVIATLRTDPLPLSVTCIETQILEWQKIKLKINQAKKDGVMLPFPRLQPKYFIAYMIPRILFLHRQRWKEELKNSWHCDSEANSILNYRPKCIRKLSAKFAEFFTLPLIWWCMGTVKFGWFVKLKRHVNINKFNTSFCGIFHVYGSLVSKPETLPNVTMMLTVTKKIFEPP